MIRFSSFRTAAIVCVLCLGASSFVSSAQAREADEELDELASEEIERGAAGDEEPRVRVVALDFEGNEVLGDRELARHMLTERRSRLPWRAWREFSEAELEADMERLSGLYRSHGYYHASARFTLEWRRPDRDVAVHVIVEEGAPVRVAEIQIDLPPRVLLPVEEGGGGWTREELLADLPLEAGEVFEFDDYRRSRELVMERAAEVGFPLAQMVGGADVDLRDRAAQVKWRLDLGPRVRFGEVELEGLVDVSGHIVRRELTIERGEVYSSSVMRQSRRRLSRLRLFRWVVVEAGERDGEPVDRSLEEIVWPVQVRVAERPPRSVSLGGGWGTDESWRAKASWGHRNFFGDGRRLESLLRYSERFTTGRVTFTQPYLLGSESTLRIKPAVIREREDAYEARRYLVNAEIETPIGGPWRLSYGYNHGWNDVFDVANDATDDDGRPIEEGLSIVAGPFIGFRRSTVDSLFEPTAGTWLDFGVESSAKALSADTDFLRYTLELRGFQPLWRSVAAARLRIGTIQSLGDTRHTDIPLTERYYSGGSSRHRGFGFRRLSPRDSNGDPIGGSSLLEASVEWRVHLFRKFGAVAFVDGAHVDPKDFGWSLEGLRFAAGPGLRYETPVGPLRVDFAWRLNPESERGRFRVHASVGHTF